SKSVFIHAILKAAAHNCSGSAPAPGAVFRALAENPLAKEPLKRQCPPRSHHDRASETFLSVSIRGFSFCFAKSPA
ncbi:MAG: hypothetical protein ACLQSR_03135, partial [Limisphaerales bacterium]